MPRSSTPPSKRCRGDGRALPPPERLAVGDPLPALAAASLEDGVHVRRAPRPRARATAPARLRQLHLTAVSSPDGRRRGDPRALRRAREPPLPLHRRGARRRRVAAAGEPRRRRAARAARDVRGSLRRRARRRPPTRADHAGARRRHGRRRERGVRGLAGAALTSPTAEAGSRRWAGRGHSSSTRTRPPACWRSEAWPEPLLDFGYRQMSSGRTRTRVSGRPVAARIAERIAAVERRSAARRRP